MSKQNPFSIYDFLGYIIPGASTLYVLIILQAIFNDDTLTLKSILDILKLESAGVYIPFIICAYIVGHIISFLSSISIEKYSIWRYCYPSKFLMDIKHDGFWGKRKSKKQKFWRIMVVLFIPPTFLLDLIIGNILKGKEVYTKKLDELLIDTIRKKKTALLKKLNVDINHYGDIKELDFYRIILHYVYENSKQTQSKLQNYVALYGFLRTMCFLSIIVFWLVFVFVIYHSKMSNEIFIILLSLTILSYIFFMGFMKFYRRFSLEGLMGLVTLEIEEKSQSTTP